MPIFNQDQQERVSKMDSTERKYTVYMHTAPNGKRYIGITRQVITKRWGSAGCGYRKCQHFYNAIVKYGWNNITHEVLASGLSQRDAEIMERALILQFDTTNHDKGYNLMIGGGVNGTPTFETRNKISMAGKGNKNSLGHSHSEDTKKKMSKAHRGAIVSAATRDKISVARKGRVVTAETREKLSAYGKTRVPSAETRAKMSAAQKRLPRTAETKQKIRDAHNLRVKDVECLTADGEVIGHYVSLRDAAEKTGICWSSIQLVCSGKNKTAGKFRWRYA